MKLLDKLLFRFQKSGKLSTIINLVSAFPNGKITNHKCWHGKSLTGNFLQWLYTNYAEGTSVDFALSSFNGGTANQYTKGILGSNSGTYNAYSKLHGEVGDTLKGIVFGTGITPVTALDYKLITLIAHGTAAGQLSYQQQGASQAPINVDLTTTFILQRIAVNNSGDSITINEIGIYSSQPAWGNNPICLFREIVSGGLAVLATQTLTAQITFQVTT